MNDTIVIIQGTTASGKSDYAYEYAKAHNGELINADARQVYAYASIGTNQTTYNDIPTHCIGYVDPLEIYNAFRFYTDCKNAIIAIQEKGKVPVIVGGTMLYIDILTGRTPLEIHDDSFALFQDEQRNILSNISLTDIQQKIITSYPDIFAKLNNSEKNNTQRLINRYIYLSFYKEHTPQTLPPLFEKGMYIKYGVSVPKEMLQQRITKRTNKMFVDGLMSELAGLFTKYPETIALAKTIGYEEFLTDKHTCYPHISISEYISLLSNNNIEKIKDTITLHTLQYAKRQMTWLKKDTEITWIH